MVIEKILLGITLAAPIGPVSIEMIKRGLEQGFWGAFKVRLGGAIGNTTCLIASYLSLSVLLNQPMIIGLIGLIGAIYLIIIGIENLQKKTIDLSTENKNKLVFKIKNNALLIGFILSLANPVSIVFWLSIFASTFNPEEAGFINFASDLMIILGVLIWGVMLSAALGVGKSFVNEEKVLVVTKIAGALLLIFGLKYTWLNFEKIFF